MRGIGANSPRLGGRAFPEARRSAQKPPGLLQPVPKGTKVLSARRAEKARLPGGGTRRLRGTKAGPRCARGLRAPGPRGGVLLRIRGAEPGAALRGPRWVRAAPSGSPRRCVSPSWHCARLGLAGAPGPSQRGAQAGPEVSRSRGREARVSRKESLRPGAFRARLRRRRGSSASRTRALPQAAAPAPGKPRRGRRGAPRGCAGISLRLQALRAGKSSGSRAGSRR